MHDCIQHRSSSVRVRSAEPLGCHDWFQSLPHYIEIPSLKPVSWCLFFLLLLDHADFFSEPLLVSFSTTIMVILHPCLVPSTPNRPSQYLRHAALHHQTQFPKQSADLSTTQSDRRLRWALNRAKLLTSSGLYRPFFGASIAPRSARITDKNALAHIASVICRYQPVQLRTS